MPIIDNLFEKYKNNDCFVESGSFLGDGIQKALDARFKKIVSIELSSIYYDHCVTRFKDNKNVNLYLGDSEDLLKNIISKINEPITFWLDGHNSGANTAFGKHESPLMQELNIIKKHPIRTHTIIIDDLRCWMKPHYEFDKDDIESFLKTINNEYILTFENGFIENDILVAHNGK